MGAGRIAGGRSASELRENGSEDSDDGEDVWTEMNMGLTPGTADRRGLSFGASCGVSMTISMTVPHGPHRQCVASCRAHTFVTRVMLS